MTVTNLAHLSTIFHHFKLAKTNSSLNIAMGLGLGLVLTFLVRKAFSVGIYVKWRTWVPVHYPEPFFKAALHFANTKLHSMPSFI